MSNTLDTIEFTESSGNVFADLGLPDADELLLKSDLLIRIQTILDSRSLTDAQAVEILSLTPTLLAAIRQGPLDALTLDQLFHCLNRLGRRIEVRLSPDETDPADARTLLVAA